MKLILIFLFLISNISIANECFSFYGIIDESPIVQLAKQIATRSIQEKKPVSSILAFPEIQQALIELRKNNSGLDALLKKEIKVALQNELELAKTRVKEEPLPAPPKRTKLVSVEGDYVPLADISSLFSQNPDFLHFVNGNIISTTKAMASEIIRSDSTAGFKKVDQIERVAGQTFAHYTGLHSKKIAFNFINKSGESFIKFLVPGSSDVLPDLPIPINHIKKMAVMPNGKLVVGGYNGMLGLVSEPQGIQRNGSYTAIESRSFNSIADFGFLSNNDMVVGASDGAIWYYKWNTHSQTFAPQYKLKNAHKSGIQSVELLRDGRLATASFDGTVIIWGIDPVSKTFEPKQTIPLDGSFVRAARQLPNGDIVASTQYGKVYMLKDDGSGQLSSKELLPNPMKLTGTDILVLPNGDFVTYGDSTAVEYRRLGYQNQVKEVHVWRPIVREIEIELTEDNATVDPLNTR